MIRREWERWQAGETWPDRLRRLDATAGTHGQVAGPVVVTLLVVGSVAAAARGHFGALAGVLIVAGVLLAVRGVNEVVVQGWRPRRSSRR